jgi:hypothetical protein
MVKRLSEDALDLLETIEEEGSLNLAQLQDMYEDKAAVVIALAKLLQKGLVISGDCEAGCFHILH